ncbi:MAG: hypothetical protein QOF26_1960, partial [Baekduia sp.]|nr:hypothetical protein [Baekduia sp.]
VLRSSQWFAASGGRHAQLIPLAGEEEKSKVEQEERHGLHASLAAAAYGTNTTLPAF